MAKGKPKIKIANKGRKTCSVAGGSIIEEEPASPPSSLTRKSARLQEKSVSPTASSSFSVKDGCATASGIKTDNSKVRRRKLPPSSLPDPKPNVIRPDLLHLTLKKEPVVPSLELVPSGGGVNIDVRGSVGCDTDEFLDFEFSTDLFPPSPELPISDTLRLPITMTSIKQEPLSIDDYAALPSDATVTLETHFQAYPEQNQEDASQIQQCSVSFREFNQGPQASHQSSSSSSQQSQQVVLLGGYGVNKNPTVAKYFKDKYKDLPLEDQVNGLLDDLVTHYDSVQHLQQNIASCYESKTQLESSNLALRRQATESMRLADLERNRAQELWRNLDTTQVYARVEDEGIKQRYFLSSQYTKAIDTVKAKCDERLKTIEKDRMDLSKQNKRLNRMLKNSDAKHNGVTTVLKGFVNTLTQMYGGATESAVGKIKESFINSLRKLERTSDADCKIDYVEIFSSCFEKKKSKSKSSVLARDTWPHCDKLIEEFEKQFPLPDNKPAKKSRKEEAISSNNKLVPVHATTSSLSLSDNDDEDSSDFEDVPAPESVPFYNNCQNRIEILATGKESETTITPIPLSMPDPALSPSPSRVPCLVLAEGNSQRLPSLSPPAVQQDDSSASPPVTPRVDFGDDYYDDIAIAMPEVVEIKTEIFYPLFFDGEQEETSNQPQTSFHNADNVEQMIDVLGSDNNNLLDNTTNNKSDSECVNNNEIGGEQSASKFSLSMPTDIFELEVVSDINSTVPVLKIQAEGYKMAEMSAPPQTTTAAVSTVLMPSQQQIDFKEKENLVESMTDTAPPEENSHNHHHRQSRVPSTNPNSNSAAKKPSASPREVPSVVSTKLDDRRLKRRQDSSDEDNQSPRKKPADKIFVDKWDSDSTEKNVPPLIILNELHRHKRQRHSSRTERGRVTKPYRNQAGYKTSGNYPHMSQNHRHSHQNYVPHHRRRNDYHRHPNPVMFRYNKDFQRAHPVSEGNCERRRLEEQWRRGMERRSPPETTQSFPEPPPMGSLLPKQERNSPDAFDLFGEVNDKKTPVCNVKHYKEGATPRPTCSSSSSSSFRMNKSPTVSSSASCLNNLVEDLFGKENSKEPSASYLEGSHCHESSKSRGTQDFNFGNYGRDKLDSSSDSSDDDEDQNIGSKRNSKGTGEKFDTRDLFGEDNYATTMQQPMPKKTEEPKPAFFLHSDLQLSEDSSSSEDENENSYEKERIQSFDQQMNKPEPLPPTVLMFVDGENNNLQFPEEYLESPESPEPEVKAEEYSYQLQSPVVNAQQQPVPKPGSSKPETAYMRRADEQLKRILNNILNMTLDSYFGTAFLFDQIPLEATQEKIAATLYSLMAATKQLETQQKSVTHEQVSACPLIPRFSRLLAMVKAMQQHKLRNYKNLLQLFVAYFGERIMDLKPEGNLGSEWLLIHVGKLFGAIFRLCGDNSSSLISVDSKELLITLAGKQGPLFYSFLYGVLCSNVDVLGFFGNISTWDSLTLGMKSLVYSVVRGGGNWVHSKWKHNVIQFIRQCVGIEDDGIPQCGRPEFLRILLRDVMNIESERELRKAQEIIAMVIVHCGDWKWWRSYIKVYLKEIDHSWEQRWCSDGALAAVIRGFGLAISYMRNEDTPDSSLRQVIEEIQKYQVDIKYSKIIQDACRETVAMLSSLNTLQDGETPPKWSYVTRRDSGDGGGSKLSGRFENKKKSAAKRKRQRERRKEKSQGNANNDGSGGKRNKV